jgi:retinol-binding protein 3
MSAVTCLATAVLFTISASAAPRLAGQDRDTILTSAWRTRVVRTLADEMGLKYVDSVVAARVRTALRDRLARGVYDSLRSARGLATRLTTELRDLTGDPHTSVTFSFTPQPAQDSAQTPEERSRAERDYVEFFRPEGLAFNNYVFRAERLPGNVGYLRLGAFFPWPLAERTIGAAMTMLEGTDAFILDLRGSGGGDVETTGKVQGFFVADSVPWSVTYDRLTPRRDTNWIRPTAPWNATYSRKPLYVLISAEIYSAPEGIASHLQGIGRAVIVGERTRGAMHITTAFRIDDYFTVGIPHSRGIDLRTGRDIEGVGVTPDVAVPAPDALRTAHLKALERLMEGEMKVYPGLADERQRTVAALREALRRP